MVLAETFGELGTATAFFGAWWLVGLFLLIILITFLMAYRVPAESIMIFLILGITSIGFYQLFVIDQLITQTILFIVFMFVGYMFYLWVSR